MNIVHTKLSGCFILEPRVIGDERGYFYESYNKNGFKALSGQDVNFVQDNQSFSRRGVLRGLHYQYGEAAQAKLVRVISGAVLDVAVVKTRNFQVLFKSLLVEQYHVARV